MVELRANRAAGTLLSGIAPGDLSLTLSSGQGALFPSPTDPDFFYVVLETGALQAPTQWEIVRCSARAGDVLTIARAQQGTSALTFGAGARVELRQTASSLATVRDLLIERTINARYTPPTGFHGGRGSVDDPWGIFGTALGTFGIQATTNQVTGQTRGKYQSTTAGVGVRGIDRDVVYRGSVAGVGGFRFDGKMCIEANNDNTRLYQGLTDLTSARLVDTLDPGSAVSNGLLGFGWDNASLAASGNLRFFHNAGTGGPVTSLDTGISRVAMLTNLVYFLIKAEPNAATVTVYAKDLVLGTIFSQTISTNLPAATMGLCWQITCRGNGASNTAQISNGPAMGRTFTW